MNVNRIEQELLTERLGETLIHAASCQRETRCLTESLTANGMLARGVCRVANQAKVAQDGGNKDYLSLGARAHHPLRGHLVIIMSESQGDTQAQVDYEPWQTKPQASRSRPCPSAWIPPSAR
jgi:hypothetical protein